MGCAITVLGMILPTFLQILLSVVGMQYLVKEDNNIPLLVKDNGYIRRIVGIKFDLSLLMRFLSLFNKNKREPVIAELKYKYDDGQTLTGYSGIWRDTNTIETVINGICKKELIVATYHKDKFYPVRNIETNPLPDYILIEIQLRSRKNNKPIGWKIRTKNLLDEVNLWNEL